MSCRFFVFVVLFSCLLAAPTQAELTVIEDAEGLQGLTVFRMTVTPAAEPVPALKHRLTLREIDRVLGNAATFYMRGSTLGSRMTALQHIDDPFLPKHLEAVEGALLGAYSTE